MRRPEQTSLRNWLVAVAILFVLSACSDSAPELSRHGGKLKIENTTDCWIRKFAVELQVKRGAFSYYGNPVVKEVPSGSSCWLDFSGFYRYEGWRNRSEYSADKLKPWAVDLSWIDAENQYHSVRYTVDTDWSIRPSKEISMSYREYKEVLDKNERLF